MRRIFRFLKLSFLIGGVASAGAMFTSADFPKPTNLKQMLGLKKGAKPAVPAEEITGTREEIKALSDKIQRSQRERAQEAIVKYNEVDYVFINGKYYPYNPENVYMVDGVKTFFVPGGYDQARDQRAKSRINALKKAHGMSSAQLLEQADGLLKNPMKAYSPQGIRDMRETLDEIKRNAKMRKEILESM